MTTRRMWLYLFGLVVLAAAARAVVAAFAPDWEASVAFVSGIAIGRQWLRWELAIAIAETRVA